MAEFPFFFPEPFSAIEPKWANAEQTRIDCNIIFPHLGEEPVRYTAAASDPGYEHSELIFATLAAGTLEVEIAPYVAPPAPVPQSISDRQFAHELRIREIITQAEALAFVKTGALPAPLQTLLAGLPSQAARDDAELLLAGATTFERNHPLTAVFAAGFGWDEAATDQFFRDAATR